MASRTLYSRQAPKGQNNKSDMEKKAYIKNILVSAKKFVYLRLILPLEKGGV